MVVSCWSVKGGVGTTVVAAALGLALADARRERGERGGVLVVDLCGDIAAALGVEEPAGPGVAGWLAAGERVPADALGRLEQDVAPGLALLPRGSGALAAARADALVAQLAEDHRPVVVDCGCLVSSSRSAAAGSSAAVGAAVPGSSAPASRPSSGAACAVAAGSHRSLLVTRACYLALRRAADAPLRPSGVVLVHEVGRTLGRADVEHVVGAPVVAEVAVDPAVARAVDAGILTARLPRRLERALRAVA